MFVGLIVEGVASEIRVRGLAESADALRRDEIEGTESASTVRTALNARCADGPGFVPTMRRRGNDEPVAHGTAGPRGGLVVAGACRLRP